MEVAFKYEIGQLVFYNNHLYRVLSRAYFETKDVRVIDKETGIVYGSAKEVAIKFGINYSTLKSWLKNNKRGNRFEYYKK